MSSVVLYNIIKMWHSIQLFLSVSPYIIKYCWAQSLWAKSVTSIATGWWMLMFCIAQAMWEACPEPYNVKVIMYYITMTYRVVSCSSILLQISNFFLGIPCHMVLCDVDISMLMGTSSSIRVQWEYISLPIKENGSARQLDNSRHQQWFSSTHSAHPASVLLSKSHNLYLAFRWHWSSCLPWWTSRPYLADQQWYGGGGGGSGRCGQHWLVVVVAGYGRTWIMVAVNIIVMTVVKAVVGMVMAVMAVMDRIEHLVDVILSAPILVALVLALQWHACTWPPGDSPYTTEIPMIQFHCSQQANFCKDGSWTFQQVFVGSVIQEIWAACFGFQWSEWVAGSSRHDYIQWHVVLDPAEVQEVHFDCIGHFRILILGGSNAGKMMLLQCVCNTAELPETFNAKGEKVTAILYVPSSKWCVAFHRSIPGSCRGHWR